MVKKYKLFICIAATCLLLGYSTLSRAQQRFVEGGGVISCEQFETIDIIFSPKVKLTTIPIEVNLGAVFTSVKNQSITLSGFYNGNQEYIIRFSAPNTGEWSYQTFSSLPALSGLKGTIKVSINKNPLVHGAVTIRANEPRKFYYEDGKSYFALAFELDWLFALDYNSKFDLPKTKQIIQDVKANGFNQVVINLYAYNVKWAVPNDVPSQYNFKNPEYSPFIGGNDKPDFSNLNIDYFKHFDRVIEHLYQQGITAHIMIYVWNKNVNWPTLYSKEDNQFFDYVINRYQGYSNIIWDVSKEALDYGRCDIPYINERIERIRKNDAYKRLITVHDYEYCSREPNRVDFISIQNWRSDLYSLSLEAYLKHADKPVMNIEHGGYEEGPYPSFEGEYTNAEACLIRNYECVFAGVYSTYYWQNTSWNVVIYDAMSADHLFPKPRFDYYKHLQALFKRYDYNTLFPAKPKLTTNNRIAPDNLGFSTYPLTNGNNLYMYLVPAANYQVHVLVPKPKEGKVSATWFNIFTGEFKEAGSVEWSDWLPYKSPWKNSYSVLIVTIK